MTLTPILAGHRPRRQTCLSTYPMAIYNVLLASKASTHWHAYPGVPHDSNLIRSSGASPDQKVCWGQDNISLHAYPHLIFQWLHSRDRRDWRDKIVLHEAVLRPAKHSVWRQILPDVDPEQLIHQLAQTPVRLICQFEPLLCTSSSVAVLQSIFTPP